ncbi:MAG: agmatinase, partial [Halobacteriovoraceae bacterium]|nr:agmatinase [Halobacteriovoraceae bacterium]
MDELRKPSIFFDGSDKDNSLKKGLVHLIGFGFDGTACFRKGARHGPMEIRNASYNIETYSPYLDRDTTEVDFVDLGDLPVKNSRDAASDWQKANDVFSPWLEKGMELSVKFLTLGGEHSVSYAPIVSYLRKYPDLVLLHLDAHGDFRDGYQGFKYSHASLMRRVWEHFGKGHRLIQYGIRSGTREEYRFMREKETLKYSLNEFIESVLDISSEHPVYLTLDLDYFDPAYFPGTGTPEPGG